MPRHITEVENIRGMRVLLRADFNVPIINGVIGDTYRILSTIPTIEYLTQQGAKVCIISHLGRDGSESLKPIADFLSQKFSVTFILEHGGARAREVCGVQKEGEVVMFENLRKDEREVQNNEEFAREWASFGDIYVNDAFAVSHRAHASVVAITRHLPSYMGFQLAKEIEHLSKVFNPVHPFVFLLGGAKTETKLPLIEKFMPHADMVFAGGVIANDLCVAEGVHVGDTSAYSKGDFDFSRVLSAHNVIRPLDMRIKRGNEYMFAHPKDIQNTDRVVDSAGPETLSLLKGHIEKAGMVLWNGPLGGYEQGYTEATLELARMIAESGAISIVGGGDTVAAIQTLNLLDKFTFVSTGGGAMLEYLANESLPGIDALV